MLFILKFCIEYFIPIIMVYQINIIFAVVILKRLGVVCSNGHIGIRHLEQLRIRNN